MRILIAALLAAGLVTPATADMVASNSRGDELRLMETQCEHLAILASLKPEFQTSFRKAQAQINGRIIQACWIDTGEGAYFVTYADGSDMFYPVSAFISSPGV